MTKLSLRLSSSSSRKYSVKTPTILCKNSKTLITLEFLLLNASTSPQ